MKSRLFLLLMLACISIDAHGDTYVACSSDCENTTDQGKVGLCLLASQSATTGYCYFAHHNSYKTGETRITCTPTACPSSSNSLQQFSGRMPPNVIGITGGGVIR